MKNKFVSKSLFNSCLLATLASLPLAHTLQAETFPNLNVGDGPGAGAGDGTIVAEGKLNLSPTLDVGYQTPGSRMLWYPKKAAFRAGYGEADSWDESMMGLYSVAMGHNNTAMGDGSTAMGYYYNTASGIGATAMGGYFNTASGDSATAMGGYNTASNVCSTAMGYSNVASGFGSTAMGCLNVASGWMSTAMGTGNQADSSYSTVIGRYNVGGGDPYDSDWGAGTDPLFEIGNGTPETWIDCHYIDTDGDGDPDQVQDVYDPAIRSNALTVYKNGNMNLQGSLTLGGPISIAGSPVLTAGSPPTSGPWTTAYVRRGNVAPLAGQTVGGYLALGSSTASGQYSTAVGQGVTASGSYSFANGLGTSAKSSNEVVFGRYNLEPAPLGGTSNVNDLDGLFRLGNGSSSTARSDAMTVLKSGQTTLTNKAWASNVAANPTQALADLPSSASGGEALVVEGHTRLKGKVVIEQPQGDISMGIYGN
jgi:hypothetical protein